MSQVVWNKYTQAPGQPFDCRQNCFMRSPGKAYSGRLAGFFGEGNMNGARF